MEELLKYANCIEETMGDKKNLGREEVLQDGRKKLGMDLATLKTGLSVEVVREEVLSESPTLGRGKWTFTWI